MNNDMEADNALESALQHVSSRGDLITFVDRLRVDLVQRPERWENHSLADFLEAMAAWMGDMDGYFENRGERVPDEPTWQLLAMILAAARIYE